MLIRPSINTANQMAASGLGNLTRDIASEPREVVTVWRGVVAGVRTVGRWRGYKNGAALIVSNNVASRELNRGDG